MTTEEQTKTLEYIDGYTDEITDELSEDGGTAVAEVPEQEPEQVYVRETEPVYEPEPEPEPVYVSDSVKEPEYEMAPEDDGIRASSGLSTTQAMDSFNSLPESVRRMIMDADSESDY